MNRREARSWIFAVAISALLGAAQNAIAQEGPLVVGEHARTDYIFVAPPTGFLDLNYYEENDRQHISGGTGSSTVDNRFQEILTLQSTGYVIHPNILDLKLGGSFGLEQDMLRINEKNENQSAILYGWNVSGTFLRKEEANLNLYTSRNFSTTNTDFGPSLNQTITTSGAIFDWHNSTVPTRITFDHNDSNQEALDHSESFTSITDTVTWNSIYHASPHSLWNFNYTYNSGSSSSNYANSGGLSTEQFTVDEATLSNQWDFGPKNLSYLNSSLDWFDETGTFDLQRLQYIEQLHLKHSDTLESNYTYNLQQENIGGSFGGGTNELQQSIQAQLTHNLYKSLTTTGSVGYTELDESPAGGSREYNASVNFNYLKEVPFGKFTGNLTFGYDQTRNDATTQITPIINQQESFSGLQPLIIPGTNIIPASLQITDSTGTKIYRNGIDYVAKSFPSYLEIDRLLGGQIMSGQAILLDYDLAPQGANTVSTANFGISGRYDVTKGPLQGLGVYARYLDQDQHITSATPLEFVPNSVVDLTVGSDYRRGEWFANVDYDWHHASIAPYNQFEADLRWVHSLSSTASLTVGPTYTSTQYSSTGDQLDSIFVVGTLLYQPTRDLRFTASVSWQDQRDRLFGNTDGLEEDAQIQWTHRQVSVFLMVRNSSLRSSAQETDYQTLQVGIRRQF